MSDFSTIYKILSALRDSMDYEQFDMRLISAERLGITEPRRSSLLRMLAASGYIEMLSISKKKRVLLRKAKIF